MQHGKLGAVDNVEDWERVVAAASRVQTIVPDAILVGGSAAAMHCSHRFSRDDDHVVRDLISRYDEILAALESAAGWGTNRLKRPVLILGSLDGVETGIRNLIRAEPLETTRYETSCGPVLLPTLAEMTRVKAHMILRRNATRDFVDFVALAERVRRDGGAASVVAALAPLDRLYPQPNGESAVRQLAKQLAEPLPADLGDGDLAQYHIVDPHWSTWRNIVATCERLAVEIEASSLRAKCSGRIDPPSS